MEKEPPPELERAVPRADRSRGGRPPEPSEVAHGGKPLAVVALLRQPGEPLLDVEHPDLPPFDHLARAVRKVIERKGMSVLPFSWSPGSKYRSKCELLHTAGEATSRILILTASQANGAPV
jgi:hypothetical protein